MSFTWKRLWSMLFPAGPLRLAGGGLGCGGGSRRDQPLRIDFYTRAGCHLCDEAKELIEKLKYHHRLEVIYHDVDTQPALVEEYGNQIPVLVINGKKRFWGKIESPWLERCLHEEGRKT